MVSGGSRVNSGRKKQPKKLGIKTFCLDDDIIEWLDNDYGRGSQTLVRDLLRDHYNKDLENKEKAKDNV